MTDINALMEYADSDHEVFIFNTYDEWMCLLKANTETLKVEVKGRGATPDTAFHQAKVKMDRLASMGDPAVRPAALEPPLKAPSDDIPF